MNAIRTILSGMSMRAVTMLCAFLLVLHTAACIFAIALISRWSSQATESLAFADNNSVAAEEIYSSTLAYILARERHDDKTVLSADNERLARALDQAEQHVESEEERRLLERVKERLDKAINGQGVLVWADVGPDLERFLQINFEQAQGARAEAAKSTRLAMSAAILSGVLMLLALGCMYAIVRMAITEPLKRLNDALGRYVAGDEGARAQPGGALEITSATSHFNELAEQVKVRREIMAATLAAVAHDLRNPITSMKLTIAVLNQQEQAKTDPRMGRQLERFVRQIGRLDRMVSDFLDVSALESGQVQLQRAPTDLRSTVEFVVEFLSDATNGRVVSKIVPAAPVMVEADPVRLEQVLTNLLVNATKYSPAGTPLEVRLETDGDKGVCSIADHGPGIPQGAEERIFQGFVRLESTQSVPGFGLGLAGARRIAEAHGGRLYVDTSYRGGARFVFEMPLLSLAAAGEGLRHGQSERAH